MGATSITEIKSLARDVQLSRSMRETASQAHKHVRWICSFEHFKPHYEDLSITPLKVVLKSLRSAYPKLAKTAETAVQDTHQIEVLGNHQVDEMEPYQEPAKVFKRQPHFGGVGRTWEPGGVALPADKILSIVGINVGDPRAVAFLTDLADAVERALIRATWKLKATDITNPLHQAMEAAENMLAALDSIPLAGQPYFRSGGLMWGEARRQASDMRDAAVRAYELADEQIGGKGKRVADSNPIRLAAELAAAFRRIDIEPTANKRSGTNRPSRFMKVASICFKAAGLSDHYNNLRDGIHDATVTD